MSLRCCAHSGVKLADNVTCGGRCGDFPGCLPAFPAELAHQVAPTLHSPADEQQAAAAACDVLDELHGAITEGLSREVARERPRPRW